MSSKSFKGIFKSNKFKRGSMATLLSVIFIAVVIVVNIIVSALSDRFPSMNLDLTAQGLNTLSDQALEIAAGVKEETTIYLIGREEQYAKDQLYTSYNLKYSQVANLAHRLAEANRNIQVKYIDPDREPKFISDYSDDNLGAGKVMVKTERRHRVLTVNDLFGLNQQTYEYYSTVDSALAGAIEAVNLEVVPVVAVITGHSEALNSSSYRKAFDEMLSSENFDVQEISLMTEELPEATQIVMLATPTTDYTDDEIQKLRDFLADDGPFMGRTVLVSCHYAQGELPKLAGFLEEWGVEMGEGMVVETDSSKVLTSADSIFAEIGEEVVKDKSYGRILSPATRPINVLFKGNADIGVKELWNASETSYVITSGDIPENPDTDVHTLATLSSHLVQKDNKVIYKNVAVFGSTLIFTDTYLNSPFSNKTYLIDLFHYLTGTDDSAVTVKTKQVTTSTFDITADAGTLNVLGLGVFTIGLPVVILIAGIVVFLRRRHL